jgi:hypothetical protein
MASFACMEEQWRFTLSCPAGRAEVPGASRAAKLVCRRQASVPQRLFGISAQTGFGFTAQALRL